MKLIKYSTVVGISVLVILSYKSIGQQAYHEQYRPQIHFSPKEHWTNDPNGMVFYKGVYHLFFQYYPDSTVWGPMHWGHATSKDLIHWKQQPIALYPDSLGYIYSGSAVVDKANTSGMGKDGKVPLLAIYTSHNIEREKKHANDYENQCMAYSLDDGLTWTKYPGNPVLKNPGITDFRDPKVMWYEPEKKWVMTLATKDRVTFFSSKNFRSWKKESDFGNDAGFHSGAWECPDLFPLLYNGKKVWVLVVSVNPGAPNKGSGTQYFLGDFDGKKFIAYSKKTKWIDYGPDDYAGITWSNTGDKKIFIGWMSNWMYANLVPTKKWRNAMTVPRELSIKKVGEEMFVSSRPVNEINIIKSASVCKQNVTVANTLPLSKLFNRDISIPCEINIDSKDAEDFSIILSNDSGEQLRVGFDKSDNKYFIDRTLAGQSKFHKEFAAMHSAPRLTKDAELTLSLIIDHSSIELFGDRGLSVMTEVFFPTKPYNKIDIQCPKKSLFNKIEFLKLKSIWP